MSDASDPICEHDAGSFAELSKRPNPQGFVIVPVPSVEEWVSLIERKRGRRLTPEEIEEQRLQAPSIALTQEAADKMARLKAEECQQLAPARKRWWQFWQ
jgi:hypothetical protein